jgi:small subunit ribosomal protein S21
MINIEVKVLKRGDSKLSLDRALQRLKTKLMTEGIMDTVRAKRAFETPKEKKERKLRNKLKQIKNKKTFDKKKDL